MLYRHPRIEVIVVGGMVRRADGGIVGAAAIDLIRQFKVDYAVIGVSAIDEDGALLDFDYREVQVGAGDHRKCAQRDPGRRCDQVHPLGPGHASPISARSRPS